MLRSIPTKLYHKSNPINRKYILKEGLIPSIGSSYKCHYNEDEDLMPLVFLYDRNIAEYNTTYDDDIYEIQTKYLDKNKLMKDPDDYMYDMQGCYTYTENIPSLYLKLIYKGTGKSE